MDNGFLKVIVVVIPHVEYLCRYKACGQAVLPLALSLLVYRALRGMGLREKDWL